jgi:hypothetical protein
VNLPGIAERGLVRSMPDPVILTMGAPGANDQRTRNGARRMSEVISTKLVEARYNKESDARHEVMLAAWRSWRAAIINAMAARVAQVGTDWDQELELLHIEMDHCSSVLSSLNGPVDTVGGDD